VLDVEIVPRRGARQPQRVRRFTLPMVPPELLSSVFGEDIVRHDAQSRVRPLGDADLQAVVVFVLKGGKHRCRADILIKTAGVGVGGGRSGRVDCGVSFRGRQILLDQ